ncbi:MAG: alpha/beta fold hydrolase [Ruminococcus sp.]|nr:alpha/beta fold hydrolase [Ruminococcus sp.]
MKKLKVPTQRGVLLDGVLFGSGEADTVMIAITGIHGNFYSNPFYYNIGNTLNGGGIDFIYAQTNDAFGQIETMNIRTGESELIGSWNERFEYADDDIDAYLTFAQEQGYKHIILAGHSLGANKVIYYLSRHHDERVEKFILLSPANLTHMMSGVTEREKEYIFAEVEKGRSDRLLPFDFMGWVECIACHSIVSPVYLHIVLIQLVRRCRQQQYPWWTSLFFSISITQIIKHILYRISFVCWILDYISVPLKFIQNYQIRFVNCRRCIGPYSPCSKKIGL